MIHVPHWEKFSLPYLGMTWIYYGLENTRFAVVRMGKRGKCYRLRISAIALVSFGVHFSGPIMHQEQITPPPNRFYLEKGDDSEKKSASVIELYNHFFLHLIHGQREGEGGRERERERLCVCVCASVCVREREREKRCVCVCEWCVCVCVRLQAVATLTSFDLLTELRLNSLCQMPGSTGCKKKVWFL